MHGGGSDRRWVRATTDQPAAERLAQALSVDLLAARLLVARGIREPEHARRFLDPKLTDLPDPSGMRDLDKAASRLAGALVSGERIALYGDYDVDGVTSTTLLAAFLKGLGVQPRVYVPKRLTEGYGLNPGAVDQLAGEGVKLLVTLDCGITAADEIARANAAGIACIVVDHHRCPPELPPAFAVLNPHQPDCGYADRDLAAVGVCFNLVVGVRRLLRERGYFRPSGHHDEPNLRRFLDLVALGTIADLVPLSGVNRVLTWHGLEELRLARRHGVRALMEVARVRPARASSSDVAFRLAPRINACGRLADAAVGVRLLLSESIEEARPLANELDVANGHRQRIEAEVFHQADAMVGSLGELPAAIVLHDPRWHPGVVGIVASKIVERYDRPVILVGEGGRGSGRTARGLHLYQAMADCSEHLRKFGGHRAAAGLTLDPSAFLPFQAAFVERVGRDPELDQGAPELHYDEDLLPHQVDRGCYQSVAKLAPFGNGNPEPLFRLARAQVRHSRVVGNGHLKLRLEEGRGGSLEAIAFRRADLEPQLHPGREVEVAFHLDASEFSGVEQLELRVRDLRPL